MNGHSCGSWAGVGAKDAGSRSAGRKWGAWKQVPLARCMAENSCHGKEHPSPISQLLPLPVRA